MSQYIGQKLHLFLKQIHILILKTTMFRKRELIRNRDLNLEGTVSKTAREPLREPEIRNRDTEPRYGTRDGTAIEGYGTDTKPLNPAYINWSLVFWKKRGPYRDR